MKIVCASSVTCGHAAFSSLGPTIVYPEKDITRDVLRDAGLLMARSKVKMDAKLLDATSVRFVATATAGTDHMDIPWLESQGITWSAAPGCNANSVAEYVVAALLVLAGRTGEILSGKTIAIIGAGNVGGRLAVLAEALGLKVLLNDPPLKASSGSQGYRSLDEILPLADIVSLHVPLIEDGSWPTRQMVRAPFFEKCKKGCWFINASRGEVVETAALLKAREQGKVARIVLDVFEQEPFFCGAEAGAFDIISPHIAGYSFDGKLKGTQMGYAAACAFLGIKPGWMPPTDAGGPLPEIIEASRFASLPAERQIAAVVRCAYEIEQDDAALRAGAGLDQPACGKLFNHLRANYPHRREFHVHRVNMAGLHPDAVKGLASLGFQSHV